MTLDGESQNISPPPLATVRERLRGASQGAIGRRSRSMTQTSNTSYFELNVQLDYQQPPGTKNELTRRDAHQGEMGGPYERRVACISAYVLPPVSLPVAVRDGRLRDWFREAFCRYIVVVFLYCVVLISSKS